MFRTLLLSAALAGLAPAANAGDVKVRIGYDSRSGIHVGIGLGDVRGHRHHVSHVDQVWVPGCIERIAYQVWVPARTERVLVPDRYEMRRNACGVYERFLVERRHYETRVIPGYYETKYRTIQHPGHFEVRSHAHVAIGGHGRHRGIETLRRDRRDFHRPVVIRHDHRRGDRRDDRREDRRDDRRGDRRGDGRRGR